MALTIENYIALGIIFLFFACITGIVVLYVEDACCKKKITIAIGVIGLIITLVATMGTAIFLNWCNTSTASGIRAYKDFTSELSNGINREITITAEDGREIFHYEGKVDIETNHDDSYIKFESEDGRRYMVFYGIQDTITIIEKEQ